MCFVFLSSYLSVFGEFVTYSYVYLSYCVNDQKFDNSSQRCYLLTEEGEVDIATKSMSSVDVFLHRCWRCGRYLVL